MIQANRKGPEFATTYKNTEQQIRVNFSALEVVLHLEAILNLLEFVQKLQPAPPVEAPLTAESAVTAQAAPGSAAPGKSLLKIGT